MGACVYTPPGRTAKGLTNETAIPETRALMAEAKQTDRMEKIVSLCKRRGFIFQSSEIYGGINGFWDYGPLGTELKRNLKEAWWRRMTRERDDVVGLDATIIMHPMIWKASGHIDTFSDPMSTCKSCKKLVRSDQVWSMIAETVWGQAIAEASPGGVVDSRLILAWAKGKGQKQAPNLAVVKNPEVTLTWLAERVRTNPAPLDVKELYQYLATEQFAATGLITPCPHCGGELTAARPFNLMFRSHYGPVESDDNVCYLRPETAQAIFVQFLNIVAASRQAIPFGIGQIGKAFRNEITPRNYTFRSREFEQMELEFFIAPDEAIVALAGGPVAEVPEKGHPGEPQKSWGWKAWHKYWVEERIRFYEDIGLPRTSLHEYWQKPEELAHYAKATVDILFAFPFGTEELEGIAARGNFDLSQHEKFSGRSMDYFDEALREAWKKMDEATKARLRNDYFETKLRALLRTNMDIAEAKPIAENETNAFFEKLAKGMYTPHVIEPSAGADRLALALITNAFDEEEVTDEKGNKETRVVMRFHPRIAPIKVGVFPLLKNKPELVKKALEVRDLLRPHMNVFYDEGGAIGRRYRRQDEAGTPYGVTIDFDTLGEKPELKDSVTLRDRDTMKQERMPIGELLPFLLSKIR
jgi:glycyl-tRNA synthetase